MYLLAFKNNEEREELYNGAVRREFSILVRNFSLTRHEGLEREKKGEDREEVPNTQKQNKTKSVCASCVFLVRFAKYSSAYFLSKLFPGFTTFFSLSLRI